MDERLREAFAQVRAEEELKERTLAYLTQSTSNWQTAPTSRRRRFLWLQWQPARRVC